MCIRDSRGARGGQPYNYPDPRVTREGQRNSCGGRDPRHRSSEPPDRGPDRRPSREEGVSPPTAVQSRPAKRSRLHSLPTPPGRHSATRELSGQRKMTVDKGVDTRKRCRGPPVTEVGMYWSQDHGSDTGTTSSEDEGAYDFKRREDDHAPQSTRANIESQSATRGRGRVRRGSRGVSSTTFEPSSAAGCRNEALERREETSRTESREGVPTILGEVTLPQKRNRAIFGEGISHIDSDAIDLDFWDAEVDIPEPQNPDSTTELTDLDEWADKMFSRPGDTEPPVAAEGKPPSPETGVVAETLKSTAAQPPPIVMESRGTSPEPRPTYQTVKVGPDSPPAVLVLPSGVSLNHIVAAVRRHHGEPLSEITERLIDRPLWSIPDNQRETLHSLLSLAAACYKECGRELIQKLQDCKPSGRPNKKPKKINFSSTKKMSEWEYSVSCENLPMGSPNGAVQEDPLRPTRLTGCQEETIDGPETRAA